MEKKNHDFGEDLFDHLLSNAAGDMYDEEISKIDFSDTIEPSKELDQKMKDMFRKERQEIQHAKRLQRLPKIAASIALILVVAGISLNSVSAWREPIYNFLFHTTADNDKNKVDIVDEDLEKYLPSYVPDGFELVENRYDEENLLEYISYSNGSSYFDINVYINQPELYMKRTDLNKTNFKSRTYYTNGSDFLVFKYNNDTITITHNLAENTCLKVLSSISY